MTTSKPLTVPTEDVCIIFIDSKENTKEVYLDFLIDLIDVLDDSGAPLCARGEAEIYEKTENGFYELSDITVEWFNPDQEVEEDSNFDNEPVILDIDDMLQSRCFFSDVTGEKMIVKNVYIDS